MKKIIERFRLWNKWRKGCLNGPFHKFLVLIGLRYSPTFNDFQMFEVWALEIPITYLPNHKENPNFEKRYLGKWNLPTEEKNHD